MDKKLPNMNEIPNYDVGYTDMKSMIEYTIELLKVVQKHGGIKHLIDNADDSKMSYDEFHKLIESKDTIREIEVLYSLIKD